ncbi:MAG: ribonuclease Y [Candidatus Tritonobacter lacicola]|nr:ribonuclease Y [Candidatus Tritonobacter lacicola]
MNDTIYMLALAFGGGVAVGYIAYRGLARRNVETAERTAKKIIDDAKKEAESMLREAKLTARDNIHRARSQLETEISGRKRELLQIEKRVLQKEEHMDRKVDLLERREGEIKKQGQALEARSRQLDERAKEIDRVLNEERNRLQRIAGISREEAKRMLLAKMEEEVTYETSALIRRIESEAKETAGKKAKHIIALAIQRCAADFVSDVTISTVALPSDDMKGRIIGREGRNIRAIEAATGVDIIIDDTPEAVILSSFDPVRRAIAGTALKRLIADGRIHPARIEEVVKKVRKETEAAIQEAGEQAVFDAGIHRLHPELVKLLGRLKYRASYGQNVLIHSKEVSIVMGIMAAELNLDIKLAKRIGLLHDIGKAVDHEVEGAHAIIGADLAKKYNESPEVVHSIAAHHEDTEPKSIYAVLASAGDALSAARPGARSESLEAYIKRLEKLEAIANAFRGVEKSYAIQAGREVRVMVKPNSVTDNEAIMIARNITKQIQKDMDYPGQIKVTVIRETRAVEYAK